MTTLTLPFRARADLFTQLAALETGGVPYDKALAMLKLAGDAQERLQRMRKLLRGGDLAGAGERSGLFTRLEARLIRAAMQAGSPAATYRRLAERYGTRAMQVATLKSKMTLPAFMVVAALFIQPLPALAGGSLSLAGYLGRGFGTLIVLAVAVKLLFALPRLTQGLPLRRSIDRIVLATPFGKFVMRRNARDFFESLAMLLEAGISMLDALPYALETVDNSVIQDEIRLVEQRVAHGAPFAQALDDLPHLGTDQAVTFARTGEESGTLPESLFRHVAVESDAIDRFYAQLAAWVPRLVYALVVVWIVWGLLKSSITAAMPADL